MPGVYDNAFEVASTEAETSTRDGQHRPGSAKARIFAKKQTVHAP